MLRKNEVENAVAQILWSVGCPAVWVDVKAKEIVQKVMALTKVDNKRRS